MGFFSKIVGIIGDTLQFNSTTGGPELKVESGNIKAQSAGGTLIELQAALTDNTDRALAPWGAVKTGAIILQAGFDGNGSVSNTGTFRYLICTTAGGGYNQQDIVLDNGTSTGNFINLGQPPKGLIVSANFTSAPFTDGKSYQYDGQDWQQIQTGTLTTTGIVQAIQVDIPHSGTATSSPAAQIPSGATILRSRVQVGTAFDGGVTVSAGYGGSPSFLLADGDSNLATVGGVFSVEGTAANWTPTEGVTVTVTGNATVGSGQVIVEYVLPLT